MGALSALVESRLERWREGLAGQDRLLRVYDPRRSVAERRQRLDDLAQLARVAVERVIVLRRMAFLRVQASLEALNPHMVLGRGYAILQDSESGEWVRSIEQVDAGQSIQISMHDGDLDADVSRVRPGHR